MKKALTLLFIFFSFAALSQKNYKLLIGTYTSGNSKGIYIYDFNTGNANTRFISAIKTSNPSFIAVSPNKKYLYAVNENADAQNNGGKLSAFKFNKRKDKLIFINQQPTAGNDPCHIAFDKTGKWVIVSNYSGGSFSILPVNNDGSIGAAKTIIQHTGTGPNKERQEKAHVHSTLLTSNNKFLLVADLGIDKLMLYHFNANNGSVKEDDKASISVAGGSGPRHIAFHQSQKFVYLTEEMGGDVRVFSFGKNGKLTMTQSVNAAPKGFTGTIASADIHVSANGKFLYSSNRGDLNDICIFSINQHTGKLTVIGHQSSLGIHPRNFNFDPSGKFLLVANQDSGNIVIFAIDPITGLLKFTGKQIDVPNPVCIKWVE